MIGRSAALCVAAAFVGVALYVGASYEDWSAERKLEYLWSSVTLDTTSGSFMNTIQAGLYFANLDYLWKMTRTHADWRETGHKKVSHGVGGHALAHFEWRSNNYSGLFQQADHCLIRMANAAIPGGMLMGSYGPNMAVKCLRDGVESANMQFIWQLDGYAHLPEGTSKSCSYFEAPVSNHCPLRDDITPLFKDTFVLSFDLVDSRSMMLGVSQMATHEQDGTAVAPNFPFALVLVPAPALNFVRCDWDNSTSQLLNLKSAGLAEKGQVLYEVHAARDPPYNGVGPETLEHIGSLVLDSPFTTSAFGDSQLFFRHTFFQEELDALQDSARAEAWSRYFDDSEETYKEEGASLYWPFVKEVDRDADRSLV